MPRVYPIPAADGRESFVPQRTYFAWSEDAFAIIEVRIKGRDADGLLAIGPGCRGGSDRWVMPGPTGEFPHGLHETREAAIEAAVRASGWDQQVLAKAAERVEGKLRVLRGRKRG